MALQHSKLLLRSLSIRFKQSGHTLVNQANLTFGSGEKIGILGPSGAGKTSLALAIMGLLDQQQFEIEGQVIFQNNEQKYILTELKGDERIIANRSIISLVLQEPGLAFDPIQKIGKQLTEGFSKSKKPGKWKEAHEFLDRLQIEDPERVLQSYPHQLSGGQLQRCLIVMMLLLETPYIIADEPTASLDALTKTELQSTFDWMVTDLHRTLLIISHDHSFLSGWADRIYELDRGELIPYQKPDLFNKPMGIKETLNSPALLKIENVTVQHTGHRWKKDTRKIAVDQVDLSIGKQEIIGLLGTSGSGKSSLAGAIVGLHPYSGTISFHGQDISSLSRRERGSLIQYIFQDPYRSLQPHRRIGKQIQDVIQLKSNHKESAAYWLTKVGLNPEMVSRYPRSFSGGQRQRIAISRALAARPELLVADEITSHLDPDSSEQIIQLLLDLVKGQELSLLYITHNIEEAVTIADRMAIMYEGKIVEQGKTEEIMTNAQHPFTQGLLKSKNGFSGKF